MDTTHTIKGQLGIGALPATAIAIVILLTVLALGSQVLSSVQTTTANPAVDNNTTSIIASGQAGLQTFAGQVPLLVVGVVLAIVLAIIVGALLVLQSRGGAVGI